MQTHN